MSIKKLHRPENDPNNMLCWCKPVHVFTTEQGHALFLHFSENSPRIYTPEDVAEIIIDARFGEWAKYDEIREKLAKGET